MTQTAPTEQEAERILRQQGLSPERCGEQDWALALREVTDQLLGRTLPPVRRLGRLLDRPSGELVTQNSTTAPEREYACQTCEDGLFVLSARRALANGVYIGETPIPCPHCVPLSQRAAFAGIPERFRDARLDYLIEREGNAVAIKQARQWQGNTSMVLASRSEPGDSPYGTGKTHIGCAMLIKQIASAKAARFIQVQQYLEEIKSLFDAGGAEEYTARIAAEPLLMLDDLGKELGTPWQRAELFRLVDARYRAMRPTVITTNESYAALTESLGGAFLDRLNEAEWVFVGGRSFRGAGPQ